MARMWAFTRSCQMAQSPSEAPRSRRLTTWASKPTASGDVRRKTSSSRQGQLGVVALEDHTDELVAAFARDFLELGLERER